MFTQSTQNDKQRNEEEIDVAALKTEYPADIVCRICLDDSDNTELVSLCRCTGSIEYVHEMCIKSWITLREIDIDSAECEICHTKILMKYRMVSKLGISNMCKEGQKNFAFAVALILILLVLLGIVTFLCHRIWSSSSFENAYNLFLIGICSAGILFLVFMIIWSLKKSATKLEISDWKILPQFFPEVPKVSRDLNKLSTTDNSYPCFRQTVPLRGIEMKRSKLIETDAIDYQNRGLRHSIQQVYPIQKHIHRLRTNSE